MFKDRVVVICLVLFFITAIFLRLYRLGDFPVGFHIDEASLGYNGYSLLLTGKDDNNKPFPLYVNMFGDNRPSGYHYLTILPIKFLGLTEFATRLPGALFGSITVFAIFLFAMTIFQDKRLALLSALLLAIAPWHVVLSRASAETIVALFFILLGFALVLMSLQSKNIKQLIPGVLSLSLSFFFYHTPRVFVPLLFLMVTLLFFSTWYRSKNARFKNVFAGAFVFLSAIAMLLVFVVSGGTERFSQVNIFGFPETKLVMEEQIREDGVAGNGILLTRSFHNKAINYSLTYIANYMAYFTGDFLFIKGGLPIWYNVPNMGLIYLVLLPFILVGLISLAISKSSLHRLPVLWLFLGPVIAAVTVDDIPNIQRAIVMFPMIEIVAAYGIISTMLHIPAKGWSASGGKYVIFSLASVLLFCNFLYFLHQYFVHARVHKTWYRNNGFAEMIKTVKESYNSYDTIIVTKSMGGVYPLVLFYMQYSPRGYQSEGSPKDRDYGGFGKFIFVPTDCPSINKDHRFPKVAKTIYVDRGNCAKPFLFPYKEIDREDGSRAFRIVYEG